MRRVAEVVSALVLVLAATRLTPDFLAGWQRATIASAIVAQLFPVIALLPILRSAPRPRWWIAIWSMLYFASDIAQSLISRGGDSNQWFIQLAGPVEDAALLMAYSYWQRSPEMRLTFRIAVPLLAIATIGIAVKSEEVDTFKAVTYSFRFLLLTTGVAYTLVSRLSAELEGAWSRDWSWVSLGVLAHLAISVAVDPVSKALYPRYPELAVNVVVAKAAIDVFAFLLIAKGMTCKTESSSSGSTLAASSP